MPGDPQLLAIALKIGLTATIVVAAATATERAGPLLGALIVTLPIGVEKFGKTYPFKLAKDRGNYCKGLRLVGVPSGDFSGAVILLFAVRPLTRSAEA